MHTLKHVSAILLTVFTLDIYAVPWSENLPKRQAIDASSAICNSRTSHWHGWPSIRNIFAFGDSYSSNMFSVVDAQPNSTWPLGNPVKYEPNATTSSDGPNWIMNLAMSYNQSYIKLFDLAFGGAAVDRSLTPELYSFIPSMVQQVNEAFIPYYGFSGNRSAKWSSDHTLFSTFFGINDLSMSKFMRGRVNVRKNVLTSITVISTNSDNDTLQRAIFDSYYINLQKLYSAGARNFLIMKVPPFDLAPFVTNGGDENISKFTSNINLWNNRLTSMAYNLTLGYRDTTVFLFDTNRVFKKVLADTGVYLATSQITNTTGFCSAYGLGTPTQDYWNSTCPLPVNKYFWLNSLHPTWAIHNVIAAEVLSMLQENAFGRIYV